MRIRIVAPPDPDAFVEYDVQRFRVGDIYEVPVRLASLLIISGYAKSVSDGVSAAEAADFSSPRIPRPKKS